MTAIKQSFGAQTAVTITLDSLANGSSALSSAIDFGTPGPFRVNLTAKLDGASASNTELVEIYAQWSDDGTDFSDSDNDALVGVVQMNGTTAVSAVFGIDVVARHAKFRAVNNSGDALAASGNSLEYAPAHVDAT